MTLQEVLEAFLLSSGFFRFLGMAIVFPASDGVIGVGTRLALAASLAGLGMDDIPTDVIKITGWQFASEFLLGLILGAPLLIIYHGLRMWGDLFESLRGHQMGLIVDPLSGGDEQPLSILISHAFLYILLAQALFPLMIRIAYVSIQHNAPGSISVTELASQGQHLLLMIRATLTFLFSALLPFACLILMIEISLAAISKLCSGWSLNQEGYFIRLLAVMILLYFQIPTLLGSCITILLSGHSF